MHKVKRLAQAIQVWKDMFFWLKIGVVGSKKAANLIHQFAGKTLEAPFPNIPTNTGPFVHADHYEHTVLDKEEFTLEEWRKFSLTYGTDDNGRFLNTAFSDINGLPFTTWKWSRSSRRVFHLGRELQMFLEATDLGDTTWNDITFPFDHFYVSLDVPLEGDEHQYDGMLVSFYDIDELWTVEEMRENELVEIDENRARRVLDITLFPTSLGNFHLLPKNAKKIFQKALKQNRIQQLWQLCNEHALKGLNRPHLGRLLLFPDAFDQTPISAKVSDLIKNDVMKAILSDDDTKHLNDTFAEQSRETALKLILGLCVYLESNEAEGAQVKTFKPADSDNSSLDEKYIADSCNFYDVALDYSILTDAEKDLLKSDKNIRRAYREMGFHWRRAHKRYAPGTKGLPDAKKTVKVKACRVRADKAPEYGLAAGARHVVTK